MPIRATTAPTTTITMSVVLVSEPEPELKSPLADGAGVVVGDAEGGVVVTPVGLENPASAEKNAVYVKGVGPQPRNTVLPPLKRYLPKAGSSGGL